MSSADASITSCPILDKLIEDDDALHVAMHTPYVCFHCMKKRLQEQFGGTEVLFADGPPPWYKAPEVETSAQEEQSPSEKQVNKKPTKNARKAKQNTKMVIPPEEVDDYLYKRSFELSDGALKYEIVKLKKVSKDAAHKLMIQLRQRARSEKQESSNKDIKQKDIVNPRELLPWCPSVNELFPRGMFSKLNQENQLRFLAICQSIMNTGEIRFENNKKEIKLFQMQAKLEKDHMECLVLEAIENTIENSESVPASSHPLGFTHNMATDFVLKRWKKRLLDDSFGGKFDSSVPHCSIDWNIKGIRSDPEVRPLHLSTLLRGKVDKIQLPNLRNRCTLDTSDLHSFCSIEPCDLNHIFSDSEVVTSLCIENDVRVAMDATTACHLMSDPFVGHDYSQCIPIRVVEKLVNGTMTNIAIIGKPRILEKVDRTTIQRQFIKYLLKRNFIHKKVDVIPTNTASKNAKKKEGSEETSSQHSKSGFCDPLDSILPSLAAAEKSSSSNQSENGKTYSLFSIVGTNILVRSRPPPLCSEGHLSMKGKALSFQPRLEYVPNAGAMRLSDAESMWNYCKGIFKQAVNHGLFRTHYTGSDVLQLQHWDAQNVTVVLGNEQLWTGPSPRQDAKRMISAYTTRFAKLLQEISHLPQGDFMLVNKNDGFVRVLPKVTGKRSSTDVLDCSAGDISVGDVPFHFRDAFFGLEPVIPLQWQIMQKRAPGCYVAEDSKLKYVAQKQIRTTFTHQGPSHNRQAGVKKSRSEKRRELRKRKRAEAANTSVSEPTVEMPEQPVYCPFGNPPAAPKSPVCSEPSLSPCHSPEQLYIDEPEMEAE